MYSVVDLVVLTLSASGNVDSVTGCTVTTYVARLGYCVRRHDHRRHDHACERESIRVFAVCCDMRRRISAFQRQRRRVRMMRGETRDPVIQHGVRHAALI